MDTSINTTVTPDNKNSHKRIRNTLTFAEAWDEVFERALSKDKLYSECRAGRIPHLKIGSKLIFRRDTLEGWIREQEAANFKVR
ncbi:helix-turn-helix domain-containing protein [Paenibacillus glycanilyticus]|uniref:helix-turn-helix domain-containing protein n=1 Tax=Paenibacillus glycanilyticus TaxID=126569 RepID=UPI00204267D1|nr:helix-turn-helix domain-containing protein [Paenibacillus glycanilyticus]MCM3631503.1 helix-turn-helix domain-containing protein [Paenibacillus glycanilyticus]